MGTGGPSSQSIPTRMDGFETIIYVKTLVQVLTARFSPLRYHQIKAQRSGFDLEATNQHTGEETRLRVFEHCVLREELVTRTGFEPMLKA